MEEEEEDHRPLGPFFIRLTGLVEYGKQLIVINLMKFSALTNYLLLK